MFLGKEMLPNLVNLDHALMAQAALNDPGNVHGVVYTWGTYGIGYNEKKVAEILPGVPLDSWRLIFDRHLPRSWLRAVRTWSIRRRGDAHGAPIPGKKSQLAESARSD